MNAPDSIRGRTIQWTIVDGPMSGVSFEHVFHADGSVTWRILDGPMKGGSAKEKQYSAVKVAKDAWAISYLAASGHTLTVVLDLETKRMWGVASNEKEWYPTEGTFEFAD